jgi:hypothetical protein
MAARVPRTIDIEKIMKIPSRFIRRVIGSDS